MTPFPTSRAWPFVLFVLLFVLSVLLAGAPGADAATPTRRYDVDFTARFVPERGVAEVRIDVKQIRQRLHTADFSMPRARYTKVTGDGSVRIDGDRVHWELPEEGGSLRFEYKIDHQRASGSYDARIMKDWALLRLDDLFPSARTVARQDATSRGRLVLEAPAGWAIETPYGPYDKPIAFHDAGRAFDRPVGWMVAGKLGVRRSSTLKRRIAVAAPVGQGFHRADVLAFLNWTLPTLVEIFPSLPPRVLIVSARDGMWRGGLSGPNSLYIHADRPLLSENDTSTLLHELVHVAIGLRATSGSDWIVEGIAEYYSLEILRRSRTITQRRFGRAILKLGAWSEESGALTGDASKGSTTARAVGVLHNLDLEIREVTGSRWTLDQVVRELVADGGNVTLKSLQAESEKLMGQRSAVLAAIATKP